MIDVVQLWYRVAAARQAYQRRIDEHKPLGAALAAVVIPIDPALKLSNDQIRQAVAIEIAERRRIVEGGQHGEVTAELKGGCGA